MDSSKTGQLSQSAAEIYETFFVPSLFAEWAPIVADAAALSPGDEVLDVACGTGVLAREALERVGPSGKVTGIDRNDGMLATAARRGADIGWEQGMAESLPWPDESFDAVVSQFGLMFFEDRAAALAEMFRVLRPSGRLVVAVWDKLDNTPGYTAMTQLLDDLFGTEVANALRAPYGLGDHDELRALFDAAGIAQALIETRSGRARFPSIEAWVHTDVKGWTLGDMIDDAQYETLKRRAPEVLRDLVGTDGSVTFAHPAHIVTATKP